MLVRTLAYYSIQNCVSAHRLITYFPNPSKPLGLIRTLTYSFSTLDRLLLLYSTLVRPKLQYVSVVWNSVTSTDARKLERIQRKFAALCQNRFINALGPYKDFFLNLKLHTVYDRRFFKCIIFIFLFWSKMLPVSFGRYRY